MPRKETPSGHRRIAALTGTASVLFLIVAVQQFRKARALDLGDKDPDPE